MIELFCMACAQIFIVQTRANQLAAFLIFLLVISTNCFYRHVSLTLKLPATDLILELLYNCTFFILSNCLLLTSLTCPC